MSTAAPTLPPPERRLAYLRLLAGRDWGAPKGFGGRVGYQAIPALELERRGEAAGQYRWEWLDYALNLLRQRQDCQDFVMVGLIWVLYRYGNSALLTPEQRAEIGRVLLGAKFAEHDPGADQCCWLTENHQVQYLASEYLAGRLFADAVFANTGQTGAWHAARALPPLRRWLDWRRRFSFSEWNSACYYDEDGAALLILVAWAADAELRAEASVVFQQLAFHVALNSWRGLTGGSQGRAYLTDQIYPDQTSMAVFAQLAWGEEALPARLSLTALLLAASDLTLDPRIVAAGRARPLELVNRERHGLDAEEAVAYGLDPTHLADYPYFSGSGQSDHPLVAETRYRYFEGRAKWPGFYAAREYYAACRAEGRPFDPHALPHALGHADLYTYRTPEFMLGCAQDYRPGKPGYQQFIWSATLGRRAVVFTTNPAPPKVPYGRPGPWVGNGILPKVVQHRQVVLALHRVRPYPIYDQPPWYREDRVHAWLPQAAFDEIVEQAGWCFARLGEAYLGLRPNLPARWLPPDPALSEKPYEWEVPATDVIWVCELGARRTHGSFRDFVRKLAAAPCTGDLDQFCYESPTLGPVVTGWTRGLTVAGQEIPLHDYPRFDNPWCQAAFGSRDWALQSAVVEDAP